MAEDLNLNTVELTSTLRTAPLNGAPSSTDYNSSSRETLVDLASLANFINNYLLPLLNALPATALLPSDMPVGIEGRTIWTDTSDQTNLFYNSLANEPLTISGSLRIINGIVTTLKQQLIDLGIEVASLQARLASTNQNDIALALQNLTAALDQLVINQQIQNTEIINLQGTTIEVQVEGTDTTVQNKINFTGSGVTITDLGNGEIHFTATGGSSLAFDSSSVSPNVVEVGSTLASVTLNWSLNNTATSLNFTSVDSRLSPSAPFSISVSNTNQVFTGSLTSGVATTLAWVLTASDGATTVGKTFNSKFEWRNYWGASALANITTSAQVLALGNSGFATDIQHTVIYDCTGGKYPVYAYPASYGNPSSVLVGGFGFTDYSISTVTVTNASGGITSYKVLEFNNIQHGSAITVTWND